MIKQRIYVETTIPCFYFELRSEPDIVARKNWTRIWWDEVSSQFELVTSPAVYDEISGSNLERSEERLSLIKHLPLLPINSAIIEIVKTYIEHRIMPINPTGDALHLAIASYHSCDFLIT